MYRLFKSVIYRILFVQGPALGKGESTIYFLRLDTDILKKRDLYIWNLLLD